MLYFLHGGEGVFVICGSEDCGEMEGGEAAIEGKCFNAV